jgi:HSP20 family protein
MFLVPMSRNANELSRRFDSLFDDGFFDRFLAPAAPAEGSATRSPALDVRETDKGYTVHVDLPGVGKDGVKVQIDGRRVNISAETHKDEEKKDGERVVYRERSISSFARSFTLPQEIDQSASEARIDNGVLTLTLSKRGAPSAQHLAVK